MFSKSGIEKKTEIIRRKTVQLHEVHWRARENLFGGNKFSSGHKCTSCSGTVFSLIISVFVLDARAPAGREGGQRGLEFLERGH